MTRVPSILAPWQRDGVLPGRLPQFKTRLTLSVALVRVATWPSILATPPRRHDGLLPRRLILKTTDCGPVQGGPPRFGRSLLYRPIGPAHGLDRAQLRRPRHSPSVSESCPKPSPRLKFSGSAPACATIRGLLAPPFVSRGRPRNANGGECRAGCATRKAARAAQRER
jgi:hypothetical protein